MTPDDFDQVRPPTTPKRLTEGRCLCGVRVPLPPGIEIVDRLLGHARTPVGVSLSDLGLVPNHPLFSMWLAPNPLRPRSSSRARAPGCEALVCQRGWGDYVGPGEVR